MNSPVFLSLDDIYCISLSNHHWIDGGGGRGDGYLQGSQCARVPLGHKFESRIGRFFSTKVGVLNHHREPCDGALGWFSGEIQKKAS